ncbi:hypothetical protein QBC40DRAFT_298561 [Triangularia verruculosa]|uniref:Uncharacterized protein n=1 Tax=Triangularia verruculosa TaxID=2587418 RepID=A0AAN6XD33_9PEZI|nr:hypothetical protein QBC40DRAFT_298561 [Triangularia verruculosa]
MASKDNSPRDEVHDVTIAIGPDETQGQKSTLVIEIHVEEAEAASIIDAVERYSAQPAKTSSDNMNDGGQTFQATINSTGAWATLMGHIRQLVKAGGASGETTEVSVKKEEDEHVPAKLSAEVVSAVEEHRQALKEQVQALKEEVEALQAQARFQEQYIELLERRVLGLRARVSPA